MFGRHSMLLFRDSSARIALIHRGRFALPLNHARCKHLRVASLHRTLFCCTKDSGSRATCTNHIKSPSVIWGFLYGGLTGARTRDTRLKRPLLYQLSYEPSSSRTPLPRFAWRQKLRLEATVVLSKFYSVASAPWIRILARSGRLTPYIIRILAKKSICNTPDES